jgi:AcrR family transcriptional regulator
MIQRPLETPPRDRIIAAATRCFARDGVRATSMTDIAVEAGLSRKTVYRTFANRAELLQIVITEKKHVIMAAMQAAMVTYNSFAEMLVEANMVGLDALRNDRTLRDALLVGWEEGDINLFISPVPATSRGGIDFWRPAFDRARQNLEIRTDLSNERLYDMMRSFNGALLLQQSLDAQGQRQLLRDFLVPAFTGTLPG